MAETASKAPVKKEAKAPERATTPQTWRPFESLRREIDQLLEDFGRGAGHTPFHRSIFDVEPEGVDTDKIEASFKKGVLRITLPKKPEAIQAEKKIEVKAS